MNNEFDDEFRDETDAEREARKNTEVVLDETSQHFVDQLIDKLMVICDELSGHPLRPYQTPLARRIFESIIIGDGDTITALMARQVGKTETIANTVATCMIMLPRLARIFPTLLYKFTEGVLVGAFAPVEEQADNLFGRIVGCLSSEHATAMLQDPEIDDMLVGRGKQVTLKRCGSLVRRTTCHPRATIEGRTYHIILVDECQFADDRAINKSVAPMGAANRATMVFTGTPTVHKNVFYESIQRNRRKETRNSRRCHFQVDWKEAGRYNSNYKKFVQSEMLRLGEDSNEFKLSYRCVAPDIRLLTADLRHVPAGDVQVGDKLIGFDEHRPAKYTQRRFRETTVTRAERIVRPCYEVTLDDGTVITSSTEHQWLVQTAGRVNTWKQTKDLRDTDSIFRLTEVWEDDLSYEAGYLSAAFDGEGSLTMNETGGSVQLTFTQRDNVMLTRVQQYLQDAGFGCYQLAKGGGTHGDVCRVQVAGRHDVLRFLGSVRPVRLLAKFSPDRLGSTKYRRKYLHPRVVSVHFLGDQEVVALSTTTNTFIAEGLASHNCMWLLDQGMFTSSEKLDALGDTSMQSLVHAWHQSPVVVGIDCGRKHDRTIVTVVYVDWDNPDPFGLYYHQVLGWLDLEGVEWEEQYFRMREFLSNYNVWKIAIDSGGLGDVVSDRMTRLMPYAEVVNIMSAPSEQSRRWKHLMQLIDRERIAWPAGAKVRRLKVYRRFRQEMEDLELDYKGPNMIAQAPKAVNAHDDYPDSLALACILTLDEGEGGVEVYDNFFFS